MDIKNQDGLEIFLGYKCNIRCHFCYQKDLRLDYTENINYKDVIKLIDDGWQKGNRFIIFSGGEPTLDVHLPKYIKYAREKGYENIRVHTNGWGFRKYEYLEDLYCKGLRGITLSIHGYKGVQDRISGVKGNFDYIVKALINFQKLKQNNPDFIIDTNTVMSLYNYNTLLYLFNFLSKFQITRMMLVFPYNLGRTLNQIKKILPPHGFLNNLLELLDFIERANIKDFVLESIPYCLLEKKYWKFIDNNKKTEKEIFYIDGRKDNNLQYIQGKLKYSECSQCIKNSFCYGFSKDYIQLYGKQNFTIIN